MDSNPKPKKENEEAEVTEIVREPETLEFCRIRITSWNVAEKAPSGEINDLLQSGSGTDFVVCGETLAVHNYVRIKTHRLLGLLLNVFCLRKHIPYIKDVECSLVRKGVAGIWGNKGAVIIKLSFRDTKFVFVNAHFHPHDDGLKMRLDDFEVISQHQLLADTDYIFWFGDLNFRIEEDSYGHAEIVKYINDKKFTELFAHDQLNVAKKRNQAFGDYSESEPTFPPTFKFDMGKKTYASKRRPAWTDRILYKLASPRTASESKCVEEMNFDAYHDITVSDHRPVAAYFNVRLFEPEATPSIEFQPIERWKMNLPHSIYFDVFNEYELLDGDIVSLFKAKFISVETSLGNATVRPPKHKVTFPAFTIKQPGEYVLVYTNSNNNSYYGLSQPFRIKKKKNKGPKLCCC